MAADWSLLRHYLQRQPGERVELSWQELANLVGGMPTSAIEHAAWWSGDRPHSPRRSTRTTRLRRGIALKASRSFG